MRARRDVRASILLAESTTVLIQLKNVKEEAAGEFNFFSFPLVSALAEKPERTTTIGARERG